MAVGSRCRRACPRGGRYRFLGNVSRYAGVDRKAQQAIESFSKAKTALQNAEQLFPQLDLSAYMSYIDKRLEAQDYAIESNDALINRDTQAATEHNDAYNNAEKQAGELAEKLSEDPDELVVEAFDSKRRRVEKCMKCPFTSAERRCFYP